MTKRLVVVGGDTPNPLFMQGLLVRGVTGIRLAPFAAVHNEGPFDFVPDYWDVLVDEAFDVTGYNIRHEAVANDDGTISVVRDLLLPGEYPFTWAGWPIPGESLAPVPDDVSAPPALVDLIGALMELDIRIKATEPNSSRISEAFGRALGLPGPATAEQIKGALVHYLQQTVLSMEQRSRIIAAEYKSGLVDTVEVE